MTAEPLTIGSLRDVEKVNKCKDGVQSIFSMSSLNFFKQSISTGDWLIKKVTKICWFKTPDS